jgi:hypothetical protein
MAASIGPGAAPVLTVMYTGTGDTGCAVVAPDFVSHIGVLISQHPTAPSTRLGGSESDPTRPWQRPCRQALEAVPDASQKYEIWLPLIRQEVTIREAAEQQQVDRSTIMRIRTVAKEGALAAFAGSKPRVQSRQSDFELEAAKAEIARLSEAGQADGRPAHPGRGKGGWAQGDMRRRGSLAITSVPVLWKWDG